MSKRSIVRLVGSVYDAALAPELWPAALETVAEHFGAVGAAYALWNKRNHRVEWLRISGPLVQSHTDYVNHYYAVDPFRRVLDASPLGRWLQATKALPRAVLRQNEWYNDFLLKSGVKDDIAVRLYDTASHRVIFSFHRGVGRAPLAVLNNPDLQELLLPLSKAARLRIELHRAGLDHRARLGRRALEHLSTGVIIVDGDGRVIDLNQSGERVLQRNDGLVLRHGKLRALRENESAKLRKVLAAAAADEKRVTSVAHLLVSRRTHRAPYAVSIAPLATTGTPHASSLASVFVTDPEAIPPTDRELKELFGWSPAETQLVRALMAGKSLPDVAVEFGLSSTTV
jgi:PAS domain-containing protein